MYKKKGKKKKKHLSVKMKMVRINNKTMIMVREDVPDDVAKEKYLEKLKLSNSKTDGRFRRQ